MSHAMSVGNEKLEKQAILWLVRLQSQPGDTSLQQACMNWRQRHPTHEHAWQSVQSSYSQLRQHVQQVPAGLPVSPSKLLHRSANQLSRRRALGQFGSLLVLAFPAGWIVHEYTPWQRLRADHATSIGQRALLTLDDGSRLHLNTDSAVRLRFGPDERLILLDRGEISLNSVAARPGAPFLPLRVETRDGSLDATGTQFSVRQRSDGSQLHVATGNVPMQGRHMQAPTLAHAAGDYLLTANAARPIANPGMDMMAWTEGQLVAQDMLLSDFLAEIGRYRPGRLDWAPEIASLRISGTYQLNDTDSLLALLPRVLPVEIGQRTRYWTTVRAQA
ncbi:FecR domain-containing protein [Kerstersia similis]|uniref:FecR domain-containing protein n=1 Tax=Kerstersia similis TaxID=206505 RepID=UPI0039EFE89D